MDPTSIPASGSPPRERLEAVLYELRRVIVGQDRLLDRVLVALLARGHVLLEGVPGLAKTLTLETVARVVGGQFSRIQFTPDLVPADVVGGQVLDRDARFVTRLGPVFSNFVLADEINRAPAKVQSALLEVMAEGHATIAGESHPTPNPFFVLATQNPIELEGTYPLPEAQLDRFLFKHEVTRNNAATLEKIVTQRELGVEPEHESVMDGAELEDIMETFSEIYLPDVVSYYIARLVDATHTGQSRTAEGIKFGASPRAALSLASAAKARALMAGRINSSFEDVKSVAIPVIQHRIILEYNARIDGKTNRQIVEELIAEVPTQDLNTPATIKEAAASAS